MEPKKYRGPDYSRYIPPGYSQRSNKSEHKGALSRIKDGIKAVLSKIKSGVKALVSKIRSPFCKRKKYELSSHRSQKGIVRRIKEKISNIGHTIADKCSYLWMSSKERQEREMQAVIEDETSWGIAQTKLEMEAKKGNDTILKKYNNLRTENDWQAYLESGYYREWQAYLESGYYREDSDSE